MEGLEQVPIPVINGINNEMLDFCNYSIKRVPMDGVNLLLDQEFLCGCDCEDDCIVSNKTEHKYSMLISSISFRIKQSVLVGSLPWKEQDTSVKMLIQILLVTSIGDYQNK